MKVLDAIKKETLHIVMNEFLQDNDGGDPMARSFEVSEALAEELPLDRFEAMVAESPELAALSTDERVWVRGAADRRTMFLRATGVAVADWMAKLTTFLDDVHMWESKLEK